MRKLPFLAALLVICPASVRAQSAGTFQFSRILPPSVDEPLPCPPPFVCENYSRVEVIRVGGTAGEVSVDVVVSGGTATVSQDYDVAPGDLGFEATRLTFGDGQSGPGAVLVVPKQDYLIEPNETVILQLQNPLGGATIGTPSTATVTIVDTSAQAISQQVPALGPRALLLLAGALAVAGTVILARRA